jgi:hypothetical protein
MSIESHKAIFGGRSSVITDSSGNCFSVSTAKEGFFKGLSTMVLEGRYPEIRVCIKIVYSDSLRKSDRQKFHDVISEGLDDALTNGRLELYEAIKSICEDLSKRGVIKELINLA